LTVDDDPQVLRAVARDLRGRYGDRYRVVRADSGAVALSALGELKEREEPVALLLADQRMPQMDGVAFLQEAMEIFPDAKRALLTAYADTDAAIAAINGSRVHYYLLKPWDPPEQKLFPVLDDLLDDWQGSYRAPFSGIRLVSDRWSREAHDLREFLARSQVPYRWLDADSDEGAKAIARYELGVEDLPAVVYEDESVARRPATVDVAERAGLRTRADSSFYDLVIVGAGPAGLAAAVYGASEGLSVALLDGNVPGGQAGTSSRIENYLGFPAGLSGSDLARRAVAQATRFGAEIIAPRSVEGLTLNEHYKRVQLPDGSTLDSHALILATGVSYRKLNVPGIDALEGTGVYYGSSISEAIAAKGEPVFTVGAGNSAGQAAMFLADHASKVTMLIRGNDLGSKMSRYLVDRIDAHPKIEVRLGAEVGAVGGPGHLESLTVRDAHGSDEHPATALFIFIGAQPQTSWLDASVLRDERGYLLTGPDLPTDMPFAPERPPFLLETSVPGLFAAGDVRAGSVKRVASAVGEGSISVQFVHRFLAEVGA
jgi:thioredoxin reductase (NADPH)